MDWGKLAEWFITAAVGAGIVKLMDLAVDRFHKQQQRKEEKVNAALGYLNEFATLINLYRFLARTEGHLVTDGKGEFVKDESGRLVWEETIFEPDPRFAQAIEAMQETPLESVIDQTIVKIRLMFGRDTRSYPRA
jgi:hypothetical protein